MNSNRQPVIPETVQLVCNAFDKEQSKLYIVGGACRDTLLNKAPKDYDLCTPSIPEDVIAILSSLECIKSINKDDIDHGVIRFIDQTNEEYEISTFRDETGVYGRSDSPRFTADIMLDYKRRDFTCNAIYYDVSGQEYIFLGTSKEDLEEKNLVCIDEAKTRYQEDPKRYLRMLKYAHRFGFSCDLDMIVAYLNSPSAIKYNDLLMVYGQTITFDFLRFLICQRPEVFRFKIDQERVNEAAREINLALFSDPKSVGSKEIKIFDAIYLIDPIIASTICQTNLETNKIGVYNTAFDWNELKTNFIWLVRRLKEFPEIKADLQIANLYYNLDWVRLLDTYELDKEITAQIIRDGYKGAEITSKQLELEFTRFCSGLSL